MPLKKLFTLNMQELDSFFLYSATAISVITQPRILVYNYYFASLHFVTPGPKQTLLQDFFIV